MAEEADAGGVARDLADGGLFQAYHYAVRDLIANGRMVPVLQEFDWSGPPMGAVHLPNRFLSPKVQVLLDFVKELLADKIAPYRADWDNR